MSLGPSSGSWKETKWLNREGISCQESHARKRADLSLRWGGSVHSLDRLEGSKFQGLGRKPCGLGSWERTLNYLYCFHMTKLDLCRSWPFPKHQPLSLAWGEPAALTGLSEHALGPVGSRFYARARPGSSSPGCRAGAQICACGVLSCPLPGSAPGYKHADLRRAWWICSP